jgi:hypothetical protein
MKFQKKMQKIWVGGQTHHETKFQKETQEWGSNYPGMETQKKIQEGGLLLVLKILGEQIF